MRTHSVTWQYKTVLLRPEGLFVKVDYPAPLRCSRCDDDQAVAEDWQGTPLCAFCRERVRETEDAE